MLTDEIVVIDKNVDGALLRIVQDAESEHGSSAQSAEARTEVFESVLKRQQPNIASLVDDMPKQSLLRRILKLLFPLVDENQRVRS